MRSKMCGRFMIVCLLTLGTALPASAGEVGALLGSVVGGVVGHNVGPRSKRDINTLWGALGGAVVGHMLQEGAAQARTREEYARSVAQPSRGYAAEPAPRWSSAPPVANPMLDGMVERRVIVTRTESYETIERRLPSCRLDNLEYQGRSARSAYSRRW